MSEIRPHRRVIEVNRSVDDISEPHPRNIRPRKQSDYPHVNRAWLDLAQRLASPIRLGPPLCDELIAFVQHVFTEEEAAAARHLGLLKGHNAAAIARAEHRELAEVERLLDGLATEKRVIGHSGPPENRQYYLLPIVPGMFELTLVACSPDTLSDWHRRFIELFEQLYETGFMLDYRQEPAKTVPWVRYLPVGKAIETHPMALPSDKLEVVLDRFEVFGVGKCQCRLAMQALGRGCGKPLENCVVMGEWAERGIANGWLKSVSKQNVLEIKHEAESQGLVTWMMNVESSRGQSSCSCCGCCCHAMRVVTQFNAPGSIAPPHFTPSLNAAKCVYCGKCAKSCPMNAIAVDAQQKTWRHRMERCVGCGLCSLACDTCRAIAMEPVPEYRVPYRSWFSLIARAAPGMLRTSWNVWRQR
jgi:Na+-translocating ferredoxin:NAD+ oxidoreductase subunit B